MFCNKCGNEVSSNQDFCNKCGNRLIHDNLKNSFDYTDKDNRKNIIIPILIMVLIIVLILGGLIYYIVFNNQNNYYFANTDINENDLEQGTSVQK